VFVFLFVFVLLFWSCVPIAVTQPPGAKPARVRFVNLRRHSGVDVQTEAPGTQCKAQSRTQSPQSKHQPCNRVKCIIRNHFKKICDRIDVEYTCVCVCVFFFSEGKELLETERTVR